MLEQQLMLLRLRCGGGGAHEEVDRAVEKELLSSGVGECHDDVAGARVVLTLGLGSLRWNNS